MMIILIRVILILLFMSDFWLAVVDLKNTKHLSEELIPVAWYPRRWWTFYMSEDETKDIEPIFTG